MYGSRKGIDNFRWIRFPYGSTVTAVSRVLSCGLSLHQQTRYWGSILRTTVVSVSTKPIMVNSTLGFFIPNSFFFKNSWISCFRVFPNIPACKFFATSSNSFLDMSACGKVFLPSSIPHRRKIVVLINNFKSNFLQFIFVRILLSNLILRMHR